jgi:NAD-dependent deacetylase sirtuin 5
VENARCHGFGNTRSLPGRPRPGVAVLQLQAAHGTEGEAQSRALRPGRVGTQTTGLPHAEPERGRYAQNTPLARNIADFQGLSPRAHHPAAQLKLLHGSLFDVKCSEFFCSHMERDNYTDPIVPALAIPSDESDPTTTSALAARELDISDENVAIPELTREQLPKCPTCKHGLLRPGVVWFGEQLPRDVINDVEAFISAPEKIDLIMVIGTSAKVYPAAGYVNSARAKGARVAVINMDLNDVPAQGLYANDWFFQGDAAQIVPELLKNVIGDLNMDAVDDAASSS